MTDSKGDKETELSETKRSLKLQKSYTSKQADIINSRTDKILAYLTR